MRMATAVLDADQQDGFHAHLTRAGVEDRMGGVGPVLGREDRVVAVTPKQLGVPLMDFRLSKHG